MPYSWTPPDPFITEKNWDEYSLEDQANMIKVDNKGVIIIWDKYITELQQRVNELEKTYDQSETLFTPPSCKDRVEIPIFSSTNFYYCMTRVGKDTYLYPPINYEGAKQDFINNPDKGWTDHRMIVSWGSSYTKSDPDYGGKEVYRVTGHRAYLHFYTSVISSEDIGTSEVYLSFYVDNETANWGVSHILQIYFQHTPWSTDLTERCPSWDAWQDGTLMCEINVNNIHSGWNHIKLDPQIINTEGFTYFTIINKLSKNNDIWPPEPSNNTDYNQYIKLSQENASFPYLTFFYDGAPYIWDRYIQELRTAVEKLCPYLHGGKSYSEILQDYFGYNDWCDGESPTNNYIWDRSIQEIRSIVA